MFYKPMIDVIFDYLDLNDGDDFEINDMTAGTKDGLLLNLKYSDESFFDDSENVIQIYPNPAISNVNLLTDITKKVETIEVDVYNVLGVSVYKTPTPGFRLPKGRGTSVWNIIPNSKNKIESSNREGQDSRL